MPSSDTVSVSLENVQKNPYLYNIVLGKEQYPLRPWQEQIFSGRVSTEWHGCVLMWKNPNNQGEWEDSGFRKLADNEIFYLDYTNTSFPISIKKIPDAEMVEKTILFGDGQSSLITLWIHSTQHQVTQQIESVSGFPARLQKLLIGDGEWTTNFTLNEMMKDPSTDTIYCIIEDSLFDRIRQSSNYDQLKSLNLEDTVNKWKAPFVKYNKNTRRTQEMNDDDGLLPNGCMCLYGLVIVNRFVDEVKLQSGCLVYKNDDDEYVLPSTSVKDFQHMIRSCGAFGSGLRFVPLEFD